MITEQGPSAGVPAGRARRAAAAGLLGAAWLATPVAPAAPGDALLKRAEAEWSHDGLLRTLVPGLDLAYVREGADLRGYGQVWLKSVDVAFRRDWQVPTRPGSRLGAHDVARIKDGLARILREETARELARGGYALVDGPDAGVLQVDVSIVDLYLTAPDVQGGLTVQRYVLSAGAITLVAELRDAPSGELIARVLDRREDPERNFFELTTSVSNVAAARSAARDWAGILRRRLDAARQIGAGP